MLPCCAPCPSPAQVAASAGVKLSEADAALKALAYDSLGNLEVRCCLYSSTGYSTHMHMCTAACALNRMWCRGCCLPGVKLHAIPGTVSSLLRYCNPSSSSDPLSPLNHAVTSLQVSEQGEVVYAFDRDFVGAIRRRSWVQRLRPLWGRVVKGVNYLTRVAFGTALIVSALVVWLGVVALMSSGRDNDRCGGGGGG